MIVYLDSDFKCHTKNDGTMIAIETSYFDGKCNGYIEGYRFLPKGKSWTGDDGTVFYGEMVCPWKPVVELHIIQSAYEEGQRNILSEVEGVLGL